MLTSASDLNQRWETSLKMEKKIKSDGVELTGPLEPTLHLCLRLATQLLITRPSADVLWVR